jgi:hypothetical protein
MFIANAVLRNYDTKIVIQRSHTDCYSWAAFGINCEVLRGVYPTKEYEDVRATILENSRGPFIKKPIEIDDLGRRVRKRLH